MGNCLRKKVILSQDEITPADNRDHHQQHITPQPIKSAEISLSPKQSPSPSSDLDTSKQVNHDNDDDDDQDQKKKKKNTVNVDHVKGSCGGGGDGGGESSGGVKIRLVVTRAELKQILSLKNELKSKSTSVEQLVKIMRLRSRSRTRYSNGSGMINGNWKPTLESIPEHH